MPLILIEGLPGTGKTTAAKKIYEKLRSQGYPVELYLEGNCLNPADYDGFSFFEETLLKDLFPNYHQEDLKARKIALANRVGYLLPFRQLIQEGTLTFTEWQLNELMKNDVYELPIEIHRELILDRWKTFVESHIETEKIIILECCFIQNPITVCMIKHNQSVQEITEYIRTIENQIAILKPVLLYIENVNIETTFEKAMNERPRDWLEFFLEYYTRQGYGLFHNYSGIEGVLAILKARKTLEDQIVDGLDIQKIRLDHSNFDNQTLNESIQLIIDQYTDCCQ